MSDYEVLKQTAEQYIRDISRLENAILELRSELTQTWTRHEKERVRLTAQRGALKAAVRRMERRVPVLEPDERVREAYRLLDNWVHATKSQEVDADSGIVKAWQVLEAIVDPYNHCAVCGYPLEQGRCYSCGGELAGPVKTPEDRAAGFVALCQWVLTTLQEQPTGCHHDPPCFYQVREEAMRRLRNRLARAVEAAEERRPIGPGLIGDPAEPRDMP